jgi:hypothetical protein
MSGNAGQDVAEGYRQTVQNYGSDPRQSYIPVAARGEAANAKQASDTQTWLGHLGEQTGDVTGFGPYKPQYDERGRPRGEWAEMEGYDPTTGLTPAQRIRRYRRMRNPNGPIE